MNFNHRLANLEETARRRGQRHTLRSDTPPFDSAGFSELYLAGFADYVRPDAHTSEEVVRANVEQWLKGTDLYVSAWVAPRSPDVLAAQAEQIIAEILEAA